MPRVKISEFSAKTALLPGYLGLSATTSTTTTEIKATFGETNLVVKVDEGIKKRGLQGLVKVNVTPREIPGILKSWGKLGWSHFLIESVIEHAPQAEHYLSLERGRSGWQISYSDQGGIDVEKSWDLVKRTVLQRNSRLQAEKGSSADERTVLTGIETMIPLLDKHHVSFLEMNPILIRADQFVPLDMACEVDSVGSPLPPLPDKRLADSEKSVALLDAATPASLKYKLLNPNGRIWMLLSGGGASLVLADEVADLGMGETLANYGEYSGAPTDDDVYSYTKIILSDLLSNTKPTKKALIIAAGIANFTDVAKTFRGIIRAMSEVKTQLKKAKVKVFVRRGGPNEERGLKMMSDFLTQAGIPHLIHHHEIPLTQVISEVKEYLS